MPEVSNEMLIRELNARLELLEAQLKAHEVIINKTTLSMPEHQQIAIKSKIKEEIDFAIAHGLEEHQEHYHKQKAVIETVLGKLP